MKKLFTLIVAICATTLAWADDSGWCGKNVTYSFVSSTGTLTISGTGDMYNYGDVSKRPWNAYSSSIKKVVINNGVTSIGSRPFSGCTGLTSVTIGNGVTSIIGSVFEGCTGLTSINVAEDNLNYASIDGVLYSKDKKTLIRVPMTKTSVTIPSSVTSIGAGAFDGTAWYNNQPDGLVYAGNFAYKYKGTMPDNTSVTIKEGTVGITPTAFAGCKGLTSITIPNSVTSIGYNAFSRCTGLTSVTIPNSVTSIEYGVFSFCTGLTSVTIPNSVTNIGTYAFKGCTGLTSITIPNSVTSIGNGAFSKCTGLTSVTIPNSVTSIGSQAFYDCTGLRSMTVEATTPPSKSGIIVSDYNHIPLYVPAGSVDAYKDKWLFTKILAIPATGVNEATAEKSEVKKIIDRNGIIYIEKDGTRYFLNGQKVK